MLLEDLGLNVVEAKDGLEAVDYFKNSKPNEIHTIFMDIMMPYLDGWEAAKIIRALPRKDAKKVTILAMSANAFSDDIQKVTS